MTTLGCLECKSVQMTGSLFLKLQILIWKRRREVSVHVGLGWLLSLLLIPVLLSEAGDSLGRRATAWGLPAESYASGNAAHMSCWDISLPFSRILSGGRLHRTPLDRSFLYTGTIFLRVSCSRRVRSWLT